MTTALVKDPWRIPQLIAVPDSAPPYDCALHGTGCQQPGELAGSAPVMTVLTAARPAVRVACAGPAWPRQFALAVVETLAGVRPFRQLTGWSTEQALARIRSLTPLLRTDERPGIVRVLASQPAANVAEVTVVAQFGARARALAMRFEHVSSRPAAPGLPSRPARWLCTAVEAG